MDRSSMNEISTQSWVHYTDDVDIEAFTMTRGPVDYLWVRLRGNEVSSTQVTWHIEMPDMDEASANVEQFLNEWRTLDTGTRVWISNNVHTVFIPPIVHGWIEQRVIGELHTWLVDMRIAQAEEAANAI